MLYEVITDSPEPVILTANVVQSGDITLKSGEKVSGSNTSLVSNATLNPDIAGVITSYSIHYTKLYGLPPP